MGRPKKNGELQKRITISITPEAMDMLEILAEDEGRYASNLIEEMIRTTYKNRARKSKDMQKLAGQIAL